MNEIVWKIKSFEELNKKELYEILKIRQEVFIVEQTCYYLDADGYDEDAIHLWAQNENEILAYCRLIKPGAKFSEASIGRVLANIKFRNLKLGKILVKFAIGTIGVRFPNTGIRISAQDYLLEFYREFGFVATGNGYLEDDIPHTQMLKYF